MQGLRTFRAIAAAFVFLGIVGVCSGAKHHIATIILGLLIIGVLSIEITTITKRKTTWTKH